MKVSFMRSVRSIVLVVFFSLIVSLFSSHLFAQNLADGDKLYDEMKYAESIAAYDGYLRKHPGDYEVLWRLSRSYNRLGNTMDKKKKKKETFRSAVDYAEQAIAVNDKGVDGHIYLASSLGKLSDLVGSPEKVKLSREIEARAKKAKELDPNRYEPYLILGSWNYGVATASGMEKNLANMLFGGLPDGTLEGAEGNLKKAIELNPDEIESYYELALVYDKMKNKDAARETLQKGLKCPIKDARQKEIKAEAEKLLKKL